MQVLDWGGLLFLLALAGQCDSLSVLGADQAAHGFILPAIHELSLSNPVKLPPTIHARQNDPLVQSFESAQWIWTTEADTPPLAPAGDRAFRKTYTPPSGLYAISADILIAVDDRYSLYVSGELAGGSAVSNAEYAWRTSGRYQVPLSLGSIVFAVRGTNLKDIHTGGDGPAGMLIAIRITHSDGSVQTITSDASWRATASIPANFQEPALDDSGWQEPFVLGQYGVNPWQNQVVIAPAPSTLTVTATFPSTATLTICAICTSPLTTIHSTQSSTPSTPISPSLSGSALVQTTNTEPITTSSVTDPSTTESTPPTSSGAAQGNGSSKPKTNILIGSIISGLLALLL